jgi:hypothetical protein
LSVKGGEIAVNGEKIRTKDLAMATEISNGQEYLLFLKRFGVDGLRYSLYNGGIFEIQAGQARALAMNANDVFKGAGRSPVEDLVNRVRGQGKVK